MPWVLFRLKLIALLPASASLIEIALPLTLENTRAVSIGVYWLGGRLFTGASLTAVTPMLRLATALFNAPSLTTNDTVRTAVPGVSLLLK